MSQKLWVSYVTPAKTFGPTRVCVDGCEYVDDFIKEIKKESQLSIPSKTFITLYHSDGTTEIDVGDSPSLLLEGNSRGNPLIVKTAAVGKSSLLVTTRKMSVEASCRKYLDAIAKRLAEFYEFNYRFKSGATIGDVLEAKGGTKGEDWDFRKAKKTYYQIDDNGSLVQILKGKPLKSINLPDLYTPEEWEKISKFNKNTTQRVHDATLPMTSSGRAYVIIPHSEFTE